MTAKGKNKARRKMCRGHWLHTEGDNNGLFLPSNLHCCPITKRDTEKHPNSIVKLPPIHFFHLKSSFRRMDIYIHSPYMATGVDMEIFHLLSENN